jgi:Ca2+ transporting ATPase
MPPMDWMITKLLLCEQNMERMVCHRTPSITAVGFVANPFETAIPEEPPTPIWELILEQFKDQLVLILLGSAAVSFVLALFEEEGGWSAFVDPAVVSLLPQ